MQNIKLSSATGHKICHITTKPKTVRTMTWVKAEFDSREPFHVLW